MKAYKEKFINLLIKANVLQFGEFTLKSGRISPYFMNAGKLSSGSHIDSLGEFYADLINEKIGANFDLLFGPAYKGIPLATSAAAALYRKFGADKGVAYNRKEEKSHGEGGLIVGSALFDGAGVIIIEDVITAGTAVREVLPLLKAAAAVRVTDMFIMIDRMEIGNSGKTASAEILDEFGITVHPIVNTREVIAYLHNREIDGKIFIDDGMKNKMEEYMKKYCVN